MNKALAAHFNPVDGSFVFVPLVAALFPAWTEHVFPLIAIVLTWALLCALAADLVPRTACYLALIPVTIVILVIIGVLSPFSVATQLYLFWLGLAMTITFIATLIAEYIFVRRRGVPRFNAYTSAIAISVILSTILWWFDGFY